MIEEKKYYLTPAGLQKYKEEYKSLEKLIKKKRSKMKESRDELWRPEDLNPDYEALKDDLSFVERKIRKIENILKNITIIKTKNHSAKKVVLGVTVIIEADGETDEFTIVGTLEANPSEGKISNESPVGKALMGKNIGEIIIVKTPIITRTYKIIKIK